MKYDIKFAEYESILQFLDQHEIRESHCGWKSRNYIGSFVYVMCLDVDCDRSQIIPLYVGCTSNPNTRILDHSHKAWFQYVDFIMIEEFDDRREAEKTESNLITKTRPVFNKQVSKRKKKKKYLPKLAMVKNVKTLIYDENFNGDDAYHWVTEELPYIQPIGLQ
jgi:predicted GIY-YIG superfamily endonuclease